MQCNTDMNNLLQKIKERQDRRSKEFNEVKFTNDELEAVNEWFKGKVGNADLSHALEIDNAARVYVHVALVLRAAIRNKKARITLLK